MREPNAKYERCQSKWEYRGAICLGSVSGSASIFGGGESLVKPTEVFPSSCALRPSRHGYLLLTTQDMLLVKSLRASYPGEEDGVEESLFPSNRTEELPTLCDGIVMPAFAIPGSKKVPWLPPAMAPKIKVTAEWWKDFNTSSPGNLLEDTLLDFSLDPKRVPSRLMTDGLRWPPGKSMRDLASLTTASWRPCPALNSYGEMIFNLPCVPADWRPFRGLIGSRCGVKMPIENWIRHRKAVNSYQRALRLVKLIMESREWGDEARTTLFSGELQLREEQRIQLLMNNPPPETPIPKKGTMLLYDIIFEGSNGFAHGRSAWPVSDKTVAQISHSGLIEMPLSADGENSFVFAFACCSNTAVILNSPASVALTSSNIPLSGFDDCNGSQRLRQCLLHLDLTDLAMQAICTGESWLFDGLRTGMTTLEDHNTEEPLRSNIAWLSRGELGLEIYLKNIARMRGRYLAPQRLNPFDESKLENIASLLRTKGLAAFSQPKVSVSDLLRVTHFVNLKLIFVSYSYLVVIWALMSTNDGHWTITFVNTYIPSMHLDTRESIISVECGQVNIHDNGIIKTDLLISLSSGGIITVVLDFTTNPGDNQIKEEDEANIFLDLCLDKLRSSPRFPYSINLNGEYCEQKIDNLSYPMGVWRLTGSHFIPTQTPYGDLDDCYIVILPSMNYLTVSVVSMSNGLFNNYVWNEVYPTVLGEELSINSSSVIKRGNLLWVLLGCLQGGFLECMISLDPTSERYCYSIEPIKRIRPEAVGRPTMNDNDDDTTGNDGDDRDKTDSSRRGFAVEADTLLNSSALTCAVFAEDDNVYVLSAATRRRLLTLSPVTAFTLHQYRVDCNITTTTLNTEVNDLDKDVMMINDVNVIPPEN